MRTLNGSVLISSAGRRVGLVSIFRQALNDLQVTGKVLAIDSSPLSAAAHSADDWKQVPRCREPEFIPEVLKYCEENDVKLIVPTIDTELLAYAENIQLFKEKGIHVNISGPETIRIGGDKRLTHEFLVKSNLSTVKQGSKEEILKDKDNWSFPVIIKPFAGSSGIGVRIAKTPEELESLEIHPDDIIQEQAKGTEVTCDVLAYDGTVLDVVPRRRLEVRGGEVSKGVTERNNALIQLVAQTVRALPDAYGVMNVQVFVDNDVMKIIEINPRFGGGYPLAHAAGARFERFLIEHAFDKQPSPPKPWQDGIVMLRYDNEVIVKASEVGL